MRLIFDCEADGLLADATKIHCIAAIDIDKGVKYVFGPTEIDDAVLLLNKADVLVAHNGIGYDYPLLRKLVPEFSPNGTLLDSIILARLIRSDTKERDAAKKLLPGRLMGSHSLKAWGMRLGVHKGDFEGPWGAWSQAMQDYCVQDVEVSLKLWQHLDPDNYSQQAIELEHKTARVTFCMEQSGWPFDVQAAGQLHAELLVEKHTLEQKLQDTFGSWFESAGELTPKVNNKRQGYTKGIPLTKIKEVTFNPASRQHIHKRLEKMGWVPTKFTPSGQPQVDESVLDQIAKQFPEAESLSRLLMLNKRVGQIATGKNAWLVLEKDGVIYPRYNTNGCVTGRSSHITPNIAQVPKVGKPFGAECRALFTVPPGWTMVGSDQSGLEQRCIAHYTWPFDGGDYANESLRSEDIHWLHAKAIGICQGAETDTLRKILRDYTKTWFYAYVYGASDKKLSEILADLHNELLKVGEPYKGVKNGKQSRANFGQGIASLGKLQAVAHNRAEVNKALKALDGRVIPCASSPHKALNYLCQSAGALICKNWLVNTFETLIDKGYRYGWDGDFTILGWIHDELQIAVRQKGSNVEQIKETIVQCGKRAGKSFDFRVPLDVECKEGKNWAETH